MKYLKMLIINIVFKKIKLKIKKRKKQLLTCLYNFKTKKTLISKNYYIFRLIRNRYFNFMHHVSTTCLIIESVLMGLILKVFSCSS